MAFQVLDKQKEFLNLIKSFPQLRLKKEVSEARLPALSGWTAVLSGRGCTCQVGIVTGSP